MLADLLERSRGRHAARLAALPEPRFPEELPIAQHREEIARLIAAHPVTIVCGETGSGKTTQLPKICLALGRGAAGFIGCTQPRRIAARSLANRLAQELPGTPKGFVGHKIRFQDQTRPDTTVKIMTDGILLAETHSDRELRAYDTLIVDEAHERSLNVDFLLGYLKRLVEVRPELKVVVTSATIDTERFSQFFGGAPVIEVSGRTYPVEVRYRPEYFEVEEKDDEPVDMNEAIAKAVEEIARDSRTGDILVFLPGEREIREAAEALRKHHPKNTEILPLFSRLTAEEQDRVFERSAHRRIVLATNVAETSLTVPGIHYVIDTGLARIKRYSPRQKIDQLRIEPISQAAARQRAGRCGRVASGIAIRLYAEEEFAERPEFTTPEILRTSLASVILRMAALDLGPIAEFPFLEPPTPRQVEDGYRQLFELGAIDRGVPPTGTGSDERMLTPLGKELARLPVDPRVGRLLLAAREFHCAAEMVILAAALSIQDPRDRPQQLREQSDRAHEEFRDDASDFVQLMNLWKFFDNEFLHKKSNRKLFEVCRAHFLSYVRMREWRDLAGQLREMTGEARHPGAGRDPRPDFRENAAPATYEQVHRALLTGLIGNVGMKALDGDHYLGLRGMQFHVWPGSGVKKNRPRWIMAGELQETTRVFARNVARVEPEWIEAAGAHLVERAHLEPHWDKARGEVVAYENVTLFGLVLAARRKVSFGRLDAARAREIFIEGALVAGEFDSPHPFWAHNRELIREVEDLEHRTRRPDVLVDDRAIMEFYARHLPPEVRDARSFDAWYRTASASKQGAKLLFLAREDLMRHGAESVTEELFPRQIQVGEATFPLAYRFDPGHPLDGVTINVPLALLNQLDAAAIDWLVPGMIREKITWAMKALPKRVRTQLVPAAEHVTRLLEQFDSSPRAPQGIESSPRAPQRGDGPGPNLTVKQAVLAYASRVAGERLDADVWSKDDAPPHLRMNVRVVDDAKRELAMGRDLGELRKRLGEAATLTLAQASTSTGVERENITAWDFGELPATVTFKRGNQVLTGYPALSPSPSPPPKGGGKVSPSPLRESRGGGQLAIRLFDTKDRARSEHREGVKTLMALELKEQVRQLERGLSGFNAVALKFQASIPADKLKADLIEAIVDRAFFGEDEPPRTARAFDEQKKRAKARLPAVAEALMRHLAAIADASAAFTQAAAQNAALGRVVQDVKAARDRLIYPGFLARTPWERLEHLPRYLKGYALRLQKYRAGAERDQKHAQTVHALWENHEARAQADDDARRRDPKLEEYRWLIEELRVSLFAQELRTPLPVSAKRLQRFWDQNLR